MFSISYKQSTSQFWIQNPTAADATTCSNAPRPCAQTLARAAGNYPDLCSHARAASAPAHPSHRHQCLSNSHARCASAVHTTRRRADPYIPRHRPSRRTVRARVSGRCSPLEKPCVTTGRSRIVADGTWPMERILKVGTFCFPVLSRTAQFVRRSGWAWWNQPTPWQLVPIPRLNSCELQLYGLGSPNTPARLSDA